MTMDVTALADRVWNAVRDRQGISSLSADEPALTVDSAYEVQELIVDRHIAASPIAAAKLGLTSLAKQRQMNVPEPLYGWMTEAMRITEVLPVDAFIQPRVEPEIAFYTSVELKGPDVTAADILAATAWVAPAIDVLDSRFSGYKFTLADVVADNSSAAGFVLGEPCEPTGDLGLTGCVFEKSGELLATAAGAAVMNHPAEAMAWFVRKLHERGHSLPAASTVLAGAWTAAEPAKPGDVFRAEFDRLGAVEVRCE